MTGSSGNSEFCFPETSMFPKAKPRRSRRLRVEGKQNSLFPEEPVINCFVILPESKLEKNCEKMICLTLCLCLCLCLQYERQSRAGAGRSGESARLPPMWPGFKSWTRCHKGVKLVVGSRPCSEGFSSGYPVFLPPQKSTFLNSTSIGNSRATGLSVVRL